MHRWEKSGPAAGVARAGSQRFMAKKSSSLDQTEVGSKRSTSTVLEKAAARVLGNVWKNRDRTPTAKHFLERGSRPMLTIADIRPLRRLAATLLLATLGVAAGSATDAPAATSGDEFFVAS